MKLNELIQNRKNLDTITAETMDELLEEACERCEAAYQGKDEAAIRQLVSDLEFFPDLLIRTWSRIIENGNDKIEATKWYHRYFVHAILRNLHVVE